MTRDIALRLEDIADASLREDGTDIPLGEQLREAAREILRLRRDNENKKLIIDMLRAQIRTLGHMPVVVENKEAEQDDLGRKVDFVSTIDRLRSRVEELENLVQANVQGSGAVNVPVCQPMPIEVAPRDGSEILGWRADCGWLLVRWISCGDFMTEREIDESGMSDEDLHEEAWFYADFIKGGRLADDEAPTHFLQLPPPPGDRTSASAAANVSLNQD